MRPTFILLGLINIIRLILLLLFIDNVACLAKWQHGEKKTQKSLYENNN